ncbi:MAG: MarR family transcriptional regulator [Actinobacteria bacterium]|nr:MarR family transcriptional regulator [Actinomycetota bacterium]
MTSADANRQALLGRTIEELVTWARRLDSHRRFPFGDLDVSRSQVEVLFLVAHSDPPMTPGRLAAELGVTPGAVTQLVAGLVAAGLVEQQRDEADARRRVLALTAGSRARVQSFELDVVRELAPRFADLDEAELETLAGLLARTSEGR